MGDMDKKKKKERKGKTVKTNKTRDDTGYVHNARYCMILPDAAKAGDEDDISSTGQS